MIAEGLKAIEEGRHRRLRIKIIILFAWLRESLGRRVPGRGTSTTIGCASSVKITTTPSDKFVSEGSFRQPVPCADQIAEWLHDPAVPAAVGIRAGHLLPLPPTRP